MMYKYYSRLGIFPNKHNEDGKNIHDEIFNNLPYFIKNRLHVDCLQDGFVMHKDKVIICEIEVINPITDYMIHMDYCQKQIPQ